MLADRYFLLDSKQVATSKASIPRGQYIINNLKTWPRVIVSQGARESCPLRSRRPGFLYSFHKPAPSLSPCGLTGHPPCWLASASSLMVSFPCDFPSAPTEPVPPLWGKVLRLFRKANQDFFFLLTKKWIKSGQREESCLGRAPVWRFKGFPSNNYFWKPPTFN